MLKFRGYLANPRNNFEVRTRNEFGITPAALVQQIQENTICLGEAGYFEINYSFIAQVRR